MIGANSIDSQTGDLLLQLQAITGQVLDGTQPFEIADLNFESVVNQHSAFVYLPINSIVASKPDGSGYSYYTSKEGLVALFADKPLLSPNSITNQSGNPGLLVTAYGGVGLNYQVQYSTNLRTGVWLPSYSFGQTNNAMNLDLDVTNPVIFFRLLQK
jgi:hypothetical protein